MSKIKPVVVLHGGIFTETAIFSGKRHIEQQLHEALVSIAQQTYAVLCSVGARKAVLHGIRCLEDEPLFNAGTGSMLQADGEVRMSAALIDSVQAHFSSVLNIRRVRNPIEIAERLSREKHKNLCGEEATSYARQHGYADYDPITPARRAEYEENCARQKPSGDTIAESGTVGVVTLDNHGVICAGTSTGGIGCEMPGRVSDSGTVAGTYASSAAGVSCTGVGEHIMSAAVAARTVSRVQDGMSLQQAVYKIMQEAQAHSFRFGLISLDANGQVCINSSSEDYQVMFARYDGEHLKAFP